MLNSALKIFSNTLRTAKPYQDLESLLKAPLACSQSPASCSFSSKKKKNKKCKKEKKCKVECVDDNACKPPKPKTCYYGRPRKLAECERDPLYEYKRCLVNKPKPCPKVCCEEEDKKPPCYPEKPKRKKPKGCKDMHTLTSAALSTLYPTPKSGPSGSGTSGGSTRGLHMASWPLMSYKSPDQPCKNPPPGAGSMCCIEDEPEHKKKKCVKMCMPGCKKAQHKRCVRKTERKFERCCKVLPPYPSFRECIREPLVKEPFQECNCNRPQSVCCQDQRKRQCRPPPIVSY